MSLRYTCSCGSNIRTSYRKKHEQTKKHREMMERNTMTNDTMANDTMTNEQKFNLSELPRDLFSIVFSFCNEKTLKMCILNFPVFCIVKKHPKYNPKDALVYFAASNEMKIVKHILITEKMDKQKINIAFAWASKYGHLNMMRYLYAKGANVHANSNDAMRKAAYNGQLDAVRYLTLLGPDYKCSTYSENVGSAARNGHLDTVKFLVDKMKQTSNDGSYTNSNNNIHFALRGILFDACGGGYLDLLKYGLESIQLYEDKDGKIFNTDYLLAHAASYDQLHIVQYLLELGYDIHARNDSALRRALLYNKLRMARYLISKGAIIYAGEADTVLHTALAFYPKAVKHIVSMYKKDKNAMKAAELYGYAHLLQQQP